MITQLTELLVDQNPALIFKSQQDYAGGGPNGRACPKSNFLKGVKWSPDGACLLTASEDNWLRIYDLPAEALEQGSLETADHGSAAAVPDNLPAVLYLDEGETIYDYAWYPGMLASEPSSCVFASTARAHPLHLWDAVSGQLRATYRAYDAVDEVTAAYSVAFSRDGTRMLGGYNKAIRIFDTSRPGRFYTEIVTHSKKSHGLQGIVSCMASNEDGSGMMAAGAYSGDAAVMDERTGELLYVLQGQKGGITQVQFSRDGNFLYTGARRDPDIFCWDVRFTSDVMYRMQRETVATNQRIQFDIEPCGRHLATGGTDGKVLVFDLRTGEPVASHTASADTLNGFQFHPFLPLAATASGHRRFPLEPTSESDSDMEEDESACTSGKEGVFEGASVGGGGRLQQFHTRKAASWSRPNSRRVDCVLAPIEAPSRASVSLTPSTSEPTTGTKNRLQDGVHRTVSTGKALVGQLWGIWQRDGAAPSAQTRQRGSDLQRLGEATTERGLQADAAVKRREAAKAPPADIRRYLKATGLMETRYIRMLSSLCAETYYLNKLNKRTLFLRHRLHLALVKLKAADAKKEKAVSPTELVTQRLSAAAAAAANAASSAAGPLANNITSFTSAASSAAAVQAVTSQLQVAAAAGHSTAVATVATVTAAVQATWGSEKDKLGNPTEWYVADDAVSHTRYFVIQGSDSIDHWKVNLTFDPVVFEDPSLGIKVHRGVYDAAKRLYARFRPMLEEHLASSPFAKVAFVGHSLGGSLGSLLMLMFLHRGVLPHSAVSPTYTFGAPAIFCEACGPGGTCALNTSAEPPRDDKQQKLLPSASSECDDVTCLHPGHSTAEQRLKLDSPEAASRSLLERMGLPTGAIRNIIMHRDIVPRAFACDYTLVADLLARVGDGFREHGCLQNPHGRQVMYYFLGKMLVLQPDTQHTFVKGEPDHPMLAPGPGLYTLREPSLLSTVASGAHAKATKLGSEGAAQAAKVAKSAASLARLGRRGATHLGIIAPKPASVGKSKLGGLAVLAGKAEKKMAESQAPDLGPPAPTLFDAVMELLDCPHPLDTLSEVTAYGPDGAISRFHNPDNYTRALGGVLRSRARSWRPLLGDPKPYGGKGKKGKGGGSGGDASDFQVGQGAAPTGGLWFLPPKGTTKVKVHHKKVSDSGERRQD
ncbi:hypothetical protein WJX75_006470 [Coccomyxa subellipsoidea]|uniref:Fungal lipase-type domain-containing protein n=1 Tax=Coccomyxa subellipsoidea TaxID=248742 RepID=A0ABR2YJN5_9CHLO